MLAGKLTVFTGKESEVPSLIRSFNLLGVDETVGKP